MAEQCPYITDHLDAGRLGESPSDDRWNCGLDRGHLGHHQEYHERNLIKRLLGRSRWRWFLPISDDPYWAVGAGRMSRQRPRAE